MPPPKSWNALAAAVNVDDMSELKLYSYAPVVLFFVNVTQSNLSLSAELTAKFVKNLFLLEFLYCKITN